MGSASHEAIVAIANTLNGPVFDILIQSDAKVLPSFIVQRVSELHEFSNVARHSSLSNFRSLIRVSVLRKNK